MPESWDDNFEQPGVDMEAPAKRAAGPWIAAAAVAAVAAALAGFLYFHFRSTPADESAAEAKPPAAAPAKAAGTAAPVDLPALDQSDAFVRDLVGRLSSHPQVAAWLTTEGLIRNFVVVVTNMAEGRTPARHLRPLRPLTPFAVTGSGSTLQIDSTSYDRYTRLTEAVQSIDPAGAARLYALIKPRIEEASADLGNTEPFDRILERAITPIVDAPMPEGPARVKEAGGTGYRYVDDSIENLTNAQKLLLRMGPENARIVQSKLRAVSQALDTSR